MSRAVQDVGPRPDSRARCEHGDVTFRIDPDPVYLARRGCEERAVFDVPTEDVAGPIHVCPYHLARYLEAVDDRLEAELVARGAREYVADPAFVTIDDAPDEYEHFDQPWRLYAIDQRGRAHYLRPDEAVLELNPTFEVAGVHALGEITAVGYFENLRRTIGFAAFAPTARIPTGGSP